MSRRIGGIGAVCAATLLMAGCVSQIHILQPVAGNNVDPVTTVRAQFGTDFKPTEAWGVYLGGVAISGFSPAPAPGVTSTAPLPLDLNFSSFVITTNATCGTFCSYPSETVNFTIPHLEYNDNFTSKPKDFPRFMPTNVFVAVQFPPNVPIVVTITEDPQGNPNKLRLGRSGGPLQGVGVPLTVTIPGGISSKVDFVIDCESGTSTYVIRFAAAGVGFGAGSGKCT